MTALDNITLERDARFARTLQYEGRLACRETHNSKLGITGGYYGDSILNSRQIQYGVTRILLE